VWESATAATVFSRRLGPIPSWAFLLQVFTLDAVRTPSRPLPLVVLMVTLSSHCHRRPSAYRRRAWLASLEAAYLLEVFYLPALLSCPNSSGEVHHFRCAPLRRFETRIGAPSVLPPAVLPLVGLAALQSVVSARLVGLLVPHTRFASAFPSELAVSTVRRPPLACANGFILS
jgi:hypothetical protein